MIEWAYDWTADEVAARFGEHDPEAAWRFMQAAQWGAGWAFTIIGMAEAIRDQRFCGNCGERLSGGMAPGSEVFCASCDERW